MGYLTLSWVDVKKFEIPCSGCIHFDWDSVDEYSPSCHYCTLGLFLPTKKKQCKKRVPYKENERA